MKNYCYTGDIKKLIPAGWIFQKLYASNYKTYRKNKFIMYVTTKMCIEIVNIDYDNQVAVIKFILDNIDKPKSFWEAKPSIVHPLFKNSTFPNWVIQDGVIYSRKEAVKNKAKWYKKFEEDESIEYLEDGERISYQMVLDIIELKKLGNVELCKL